MAGLPEAEIDRVVRWCEQRVPEHVRDQLRIECEVAPRFARHAGTWTLYWLDRNLRFHLYDRVPPNPEVDVLLGELDRDPTAIFWG